MTTAPAERAPTAIDTVAEAEPSEAQQFLDALATLVPLMALALIGLLVLAGWLS